MVVAAVAAAVGVVAVAGLAFQMITVIGERDEAEATASDMADELADREERVAELEADRSVSRQEAAELRAEMEEGEIAAVDLLTELNVSVGMTAEDAACVSRYSFDEAGFSFLKQWADAGDPSSVASATVDQVLTRAEQACGVDPLAARGPFTYGDHPELDRLWDDCEAGDGAACDLLFYNSPLSSDYEAFAATCGGRIEPSQDTSFCRDQI